MIYPAYQEAYIFVWHYHQWCAQILYITKLIWKVILKSTGGRHTTVHLFLVREFVGEYPGSVNMQSLTNVFFAITAFSTLQRYNTAAIERFL